MKPVSPVIPDENHNEVVIAEHQDEYQDLPSIRLADQSILTRWELSDEEKAIVANTGSIYLHMHTFGGSAFESGITLILDPEYMEQILKSQSKL